MTFFRRSPSCVYIEKTQSQIHINNYDCILLIINLFNRWVFGNHKVLLIYLILYLFNNYRFRVCIFYAKRCILVLALIKNVKKQTRKQIYVNCIVNKSLCYEFFPKQTTFIFALLLLALSSSKSNVFILANRVVIVKVL